LGPSDGLAKPRYPGGNTVQNGLDNPRYSESWPLGWPAISLAKSTKICGETTRRLWGTQRICDGCSVPKEKLKHRELLSGLAEATILVKPKQASVSLPSSLFKPVGKRWYSILHSNTGVGAQILSGSLISRNIFGISPFRIIRNHPEWLFELNRESPAKPVRNKKEKEAKPLSTIQRMVRDLYPERGSTFSSYGSNSD